MTNVDDDDDKEWLFLGGFRSDIPLERPSLNSPRLKLIDALIWWAREMENHKRRILIFFLVVAVINGEPIVPALCFFGDSVMDAGNNNYLTTLLRANFLPYGRDFVDHKPTGRFCNGKLAIDYTAEYLGFDTYPPPYLSRPSNGTLLLTGANFASAGSGYYEGTALIYQAISLRRQLAYYKDWQNRVTEMVGREKANAIFSGGIHILSAGSSDFLQNYYINPFLNRVYSVAQFSDILMASFATFVQGLYDAGVRRFGVITLPPAGCLPAAITIFNWGSNTCMQRLNDDAMIFNNKLNETSQNMVVRFPDLKIVVFDIYKPLLAMVTTPGDRGFCESRKGCCGTGTLETSLLCNERSIGTCPNATGYVFWDGFHPSDTANQLLAQSLLAQGIPLIS
ncbi:hypothetical protein L2E82_35800 [Cichorium intybus]|uniref:Uncharacterized protein n=1 Tax=Cichorium intybus TaxID=13427 RepID=A0ACB9BPR3_CICIN|nr:hypothetical protein L2E82_35800 [Cichorium intybus]